MVDRNGSITAEWSSDHGDINGACIPSLSQGEWLQRYLASYQDRHPQRAQELAAVVAQCCFTLDETRYCAMKIIGAEACISSLGNEIGEIVEQALTFQTGLGEKEPMLQNASSKDGHTADRVYIDNATANMPEDGYMDRLKKLLKVSHVLQDACHVIGRLKKTLNNCYSREGTDVGLISYAVACRKLTQAFFVYDESRISRLDNALLNGELTGGRVPVGDGADVPEGDGDGPKHVYRAMGNGACITEDELHWLKTTGSAHILTVKLQSDSLLQGSTTRPLTRT